MSTGRLVHIQTVNQTSAAATVSLTGASDNAVHVVMFNNLKTSSDTKNPRLRLTKTSDSSADSTSNYDSITRSLRTDTTYNYGSGTNGTSWSIGNVGTGSDGQEVINGFFYIYNLFDSSAFAYCTTEVMYLNHGGVLFGQMGGGNHKVTQSNNGVQFLEGSGDTITGKFSLYKVML